MDEALIRQLKQKVALLEFWLQELKNIDAKRHKELAALQSDLRGFIIRMETRLRTLKERR
jgi:predicted component of type VI protein secretion system